MHKQVHSFSLWKVFHNSYSEDSGTDVLRLPIFYSVTIKSAATMRSSSNPFFDLREIWHEEGWGFRTTLILVVSSGITMIRLVVTTISKGANCWWDEACKENVWKWVKHHNFLHVPTVTEKKTTEWQKTSYTRNAHVFEKYSTHWRFDVVRCYLIWSKSFF